MVVNRTDLVRYVSIAVSNAVEHIVFPIESYFLLKVDGRFSFGLVVFFGWFGVGFLFLVGWGFVVVYICLVYFVVFLIGGGGDFLPLY